MFVGGDTLRCADWRGEGKTGVGSSSIHSRAVRLLVLGVRAVRCKPVRVCLEVVNVWMQGGMQPLYSQLCLC